MHKLTNDFDCSLLTDSRRRLLDYHLSQFKKEIDESTLSYALRKVKKSSRMRSLMDMYYSKFMHAISPYHEVYYGPFNEVIERFSKIKEQWREENNEPKCFSNASMRDHFCKLLKSKPSDFIKRRPNVKGFLIQPRSLSIHKYSEEEWINEVKQWTSIRWPWIQIKDTMKLKSTYRLRLTFIKHHMLISCFECSLWPNLIQPLRYLPLIVLILTLLLSSATFNSTYRHYLTSIKYQLWL